jgi:hypothetical protein
MVGFNLPDEERAKLVAEYGVEAVAPVAPVTAIPEGAVVIEEYVAPAEPVAPVAEVPAADTTVGA